MRRAGPLHSRIPLGQRRSSGIESLRGDCVTQVVQTNRERISRRQIDKFAERRAELAASALRTLSELGYARTSLREIAQNSDFSHGVLHYYFSDKVDLITEGVRQYKAECVTRYDELVDSSTTAEQLLHGFGAGMAATLREDAPMHRLWYDMRAQSYFEESFRADVVEIDLSLEHMIWRIVHRYSELADGELLVGSPVAYALFDGLFQQALLKFLCGLPGADAQLSTDVEQVLAGLLRPA